MELPEESIKPFGEIQLELPLVEEYRPSEEIPEVSKLVFCEVQILKEL